MSFFTVRRKEAKARLDWFCNRKEMGKMQKLGGTWSVSLLISPSPKEIAGPGRAFSPPAVPLAYTHRPLL